MPDSECRKSLYDLTFDALERELIGAGIRPSHARTLWRALYRDAPGDLMTHPEFLPPLRRWMKENVGAEARFSAEMLQTVADHRSSDGSTRKFLLKLADGQTIETVIMGYPGRFTACVSTQAGCAMGCVFCATGQIGFSRHLRPGEIVTQALHCQRALQSQGESGLRNIVLMGMGEPLHNYDAVISALEIITDTRGLNIGPGRITLSTVGLVPGILRMAQENQPYNLAVSLHAANDEERSKLAPINRRWPLAELMAACRSYAQTTGRRIFFEWTLIAGVNDSTWHAEEVAALLAGIDAHVNLIPLNPTGGFSGAAAESRAGEQFQRVLRGAGIPSTLRQRRGIDVAAGCGQLKGMVG